MAKEINIEDNEIIDAFSDIYDNEFNENTYENHVLDNTPNTTPYNFANTIKYDTLKQKLQILHEIDKKLDLLNSNEVIIEEKEHFDIPKIKLSFNKFIIISFFIFAIILLIIIFVIKKKDQLIL